MRGWKKSSNTKTLLLFVRPVTRQMAITCFWGPATVMVLENPQTSKNTFTDLPSQQANDESYYMIYRGFNTRARRRDSLDPIGTWERRDIIIIFFFFSTKTQNILLLFGHFSSSVLYCVQCNV